MFHCLDDGALEITCPSLHWILIKDTAYYISDGTTCPPNATNTTDTHCLAPGKVPEVRAGCHQHEHCDDVTIPQRTTSTCTGSTHYVWIQYQCEPCKCYKDHYTDVIMCAIASQITSLTIVYSTVYSGSRSKKTSKPRFTGLCEGNSPGTDEFPAQMANNAENISIWWRHHAVFQVWRFSFYKDKTVVRPSYHYNENSYTAKTIYLYWFHYNDVRGIPNHRQLDYNLLNSLFGLIAKKTRKLRIIDSLWRI